MAGWDIVLLETGDGGDFTLKGNDLAVFFNDENEFYLRMFGGNVEQDTNARRLAGDEDFSYWGNFMIGTDPKLWFNSLTERTLNKTPLNSQGRITIENAIKKDLTGLDISVNVEIIGIDRVRITIKNFLGTRTAVSVFSFSRNTSTGDFNLDDFDHKDFY